MAEIEAARKGVKTSLLYIMKAKVMFSVHPGRLPKLALGGLLHVFTTDKSLTWVVGVDSASKDEVSLFEKEIEKYAKPGAILGIHAATGVYQGKKFDNTKDPEFLVQKEKWVLMANKASWFTNMIAASSAPKA